jgi:hypothetical protein
MHVVRWVRPTLVSPIKRTPARRRRESHAHPERQHAAGMAGQGGLMIINYDATPIDLADTFRVN